MQGLNGTFPAKIINPRPRVMRDDNDQVRRVTNFQLAFDCDDDLAAGIGEAAQNALKHIRAGAQKSANILFDNVQCKCSFDAGNVEGGKHVLEKAVGVRATITKAGVEDASPRLVLTFAAATREDDLWWLTQHMDESLKVKIVASQLELPATGNGKAKRKRDKDGAGEEQLPGTAE